MDSADERTDAGRPGDGDDPLSLLLAAFAAAPAEPPAEPGPPPAAEAPPLPEPDLPAAPTALPSLSCFPVTTVVETDPPVAGPSPALDDPPLPDQHPLSEPQWADPEPTPPVELPSVEMPSFTELMGLPGPAPDSSESPASLPDIEGDAPEPLADRPAERTDHTPDSAGPVDDPNTDPDLGLFADGGVVEEPALDGPVTPVATPDEAAFAGWAPELPDFGGAEAPVAPSSLLSYAELSLDAAPDEPPAGEQHLVFTLAGAEYAAPLADVLEIGHPPPVTPVPHVPGWVLGVGSVRGDIVSVVDLRGFLGLPGDRGGRPGRFVVARGGPGGVAAGLVVDGVREIFRLAPERVAPPAEGDGPAVEDVVRPYLRGLTRHAGRTLRVLDLGRLLNSAEMRQFEPV